MIWFDVLVLFPCNGLQSSPSDVKANQKTLFGFTSESEPESFQAQSLYYWATKRKKTPSNLIKLTLTTSADLLVWLIIVCVSLNIELEVRRCCRTAIIFSPHVFTPSNFSLFWWIFAFWEVTINYWHDFFVFQFYLTKSDFCYKFRERIMGYSLIMQHI